MATQPLILPPTTGKIYQVLGAPYRFLVTSAESGGSFALIEVTALPHSAVPLHKHTREDETFFMLEGILQVKCGDRSHTLNRNSTAFLPRNIPHGFANEEDTVAKCLVFITPGGFEKCLEEFARLPAGQPPAPETLVAIGQKYGLEFLPP
jgi:quercetin dioxygenase-like cupin family protein